MDLQAFAVVAAAVVVAVVVVVAAIAVAFVVAVAVIVAYPEWSHSLSTTQGVYPGLILCITVWSLLFIRQRPSKIYLLQSWYILESILENISRF